MDKQIKQLYYQLYVTSFEIYKSYFSEWVTEHCGIESWIVELQFLNY